MKSLSSIKFNTVEDVANICKVCAETVRRWVKAGKLKSTRIGRKYLIPESEVRKLLFDQGQELPPEIATEEQLFDRVAWMATHQDLYDAWKSNRRNTPWAKMKLQDYVAYWELILKPRYEKSVGQYYTTRPSNRWLKEKGKAKQFITAIIKGYLREAGIYTVTDFFHKTTNLK